MSNSSIVYPSSHLWQAAHIHGREMVPSAEGWISRSYGEVAKVEDFLPSDKAERKFGLVAARRAKHLVDVSKKFVLTMVGGAAEQEQVRLIPLQRQEWYGPRWE